MNEFGLGITEKSKRDCHALMNTEQSVPIDSIFRDDLFKSTCKMLQGRNESRIILDISRLIVPSVEMLVTYGAAHLQCLTDSTN